MLKGKALQDFEIFTCEKYGFSEEESEDFLKQPLEMQQGVLRAFWESKGIWIVVKPQFEVGLPLSCEFYYKIYNRNKPHSIESGLFPDYNTAFTHAIDKACEVYGGEG